MALAAVVLLGPPGSGKSAVGEALGRRGLRWRDVEAAILQRWTTRERFLENKNAALAESHDELAAMIATAGPPVAFETTGLSDADFLERLRSTTEVLIVRLDVAEPEAISRVRARPPGRHLTDDPETSRVIWRAFYDTAAPRHPVDLAVDTESQGVEHVADTIVAFIASRHDA